MSVFLKIKGNYYKDLDILFAAPSVLKNPQRFYTNYGTGTSYYPEIDVDDEDIRKMLNTTPVPPKGCMLYMTPGCPFSFDDIRKNYTIKRGVDNGDFNVFSNLRLKREYVDLAVIPGKNAVVFMNHTWNHDTTITEFLRVIHQYAGYEDVKPSELVTAQTAIGYGDVPDAYEMLYKGTLVKPAVSYKQLDMNFGLELTDDMVELVYRTGIISLNYAEHTMDKCALEIAALNQYNWRDYPRTMYTLKSLLTWNRASTYSEICKAPSRQPKSIKQIITTNFDKEAASQKDYDMALRLMKKVLNIEGTKFVPYESIQRRMNELRVPLSLFLEIFDTVVKITPKAYEADNGTV